MAYNTRSDFLHIVQERGYLYQATDLEALDVALNAGSVTAYIGFDMTADSLHVGSLIQIMLLYWFQQTGHHPIVLMGGGTTRIGDPSGKDESRKLLDDDMIAHNMAGIRSVFDAYIQFGDNKAIMANNADWLDDLNYIDFLRCYGPHFTINRMMTFESVKRRLEREQPLTFLEFNYMVLQAYDFVELNRRYGCQVQFGGSDQWGNIISGVELGRRVTGTSLFGLTTPLIVTASGAKMGKSAGEAVWLNAQRLPHFDFYQFWRNTDDADVGRFLRLFTDLPIDEIKKLETLEGAEINEAKTILAHAVTRMARGKDAAEAAVQAARNQFGGTGSGEGLPEIIIDQPLRPSMPLVEVLKLAGFAQSNGEARRMIRNRGARINDKVAEDENATVTTSDLNGNKLKVSSGKKRHIILCFK